MREELEQCPFCGARDVVLRHGSDMPGWDEDVCAHQCRKCEATGPTMFKRQDEGPAWNTRAKPPQAADDNHKALVEAARLASIALDELQGRASSFGVSGVYFDEPCFTENVLALAKASDAEDALNQALAAFQSRQEEK